MNTDIRTLVDGLRPVGDFTVIAERTAEILNSRAQDIIPCDEEDEQEVAELNELADFWSTVAERVNPEPDAAPDFEPSPDPNWMNP